MKKINIAASILAISALGISSCKTDDVVDPVENPTVTLTASTSIISENLGSATFDVTLSSAAVKEVTMNLEISGTASSSDYVLSATTITIAEGQTTGSVSITATQDEEEEGNETVIVSISSATNAVVNGVETAQITIEDDDVSAGEGLLILNEICYDPSNNALDGDANGDGTYSQAEDEFLELVNFSSVELDISGYTVFDAENLTLGTPNHTFPSGTVIPAGKAIVLFGGGTPTGTFGNAIVQTSTSGDLNMNNAGDSIYIFDTDNEQVIFFDIEPLSNNPNESYTRNPDLTGEFEQHSANTPLLFSPGTKVDGSPF